MKQCTLLVLATLLLASCVSNGKYSSMQTRWQNRFDSLNRVFSRSQSDLSSCQSNVAELTAQRNSLQTQNDNLTKQVGFLKENNTMALNQLRDLSVITGTQAESIRKSLDNIGALNAYVQDLQTALARKDSLNMALVMNLKGAVGDMNDQDINIKVDKGVVFIDISDKLLFRSGRYEVTQQAQVVLGKVAQVLKNQPHIEFMVEGHTDNVPFSRPPLLDNWDLSVKRATAVVRILQNRYGLAPEHITAAGRSEYDPLQSNETADGRAANRRTRIVILPELDQFFQLLERPSHQQTQGSN